MHATAAQLGSLTEVLADLLTRKVRENDRTRAALHVLDWLGCAMAGAVTPEGQAIGLMVSTHPFALAGTEQEGSIAALGALGSLLEMDDVHRAALLHPGPVIVPVVLGMQDGDPLKSLIHGYEAMIRLGASVGPGHYAMFHNTSTCGGLGAAVAASSMANADRRQMVGAMGHAMSLAGGVWQCRNEQVSTKHLHVAEAARRGLTATRYAMAGLGGPRYILEGPQGFFAAIARDGTPDTVTTNPDAPWKLHEVSFKPWPACRHAHPVIDAALILRDQLQGRTPTTIHIATYADAVLFCDRSNPQTAAEARFSLQHAVAVALQDGPPSLAAFAPENLPTYAALRAVTTVSSDTMLTAAYPAHFGATMTVQTADGPLTAQVTDAWGDTENPMDEAAIIAKFHRLADHAAVPYPLARALCSATLALPETNTAAALHPIMHQIARQTGAFP